MLKDIFSNQLLIRQVGNVAHHAGYKELWLGYGWSYLEPMIFAVAYYLFVRLVRGGDAGAADTLILTIISGQAVYDWFGKVITGAPGTLEKYQGILLTMCIKPLLLLAADFYYYFKSSLSRFVLLLGALILLGVTPTLSWILAPAVMLLIAVFLFPVAVILGIVGVYVKDVGRLMSTVARLMIFVTPVLFRLNDVHSHYRDIVEFNPITQLIEAMRSVMIYGTAPTAYGVAYVLAVSAILWAFAYFLLQKFGRQLAKEL